MGARAKVAVLEAGSNSLKLYLVDPDAGEAGIETFKYPWTLAHDLFSSGALPATAADEIVARIRDAQRDAGEATLPGAIAVATGVFRELPDLDALVARVRADTGVRLRVISGADEARLMARGLRELPVEPPVLLCDLGGATTEWVWTAPGAEPGCGSLRLGAIRHGYLADAEAHVARELAQLPAVAGATVIATGGTAEALAQIVGRDRVARAELREVIERVRRDGPPASLKPSRQKVLLPGLTILDRLLAHCGAGEVRYGTAAVRHGMVRRLLALLERVPAEEIHATQLLRTMDAGSLVPSHWLGGGELAPGAALGRYRVVSTIGRGGMGVVYRAHDPELARDVALKVMRARGGAGDRLLREAQALAKLSHPNVVAVHDVGRVGDDVFIAMELVEGQPLYAWRRGKRGIDAIVAVFAAAGRGLAATHAAGLVQRDFKPDNVIVGADGRVRLVDFGLASLVAAETAPAGTGAAAPGTTGSGVVGTPAYMAPEQFARREVDARTDQFSFCVALWEALYGELPFAGETIADIERAVASGAVRPPPPGANVPARLHEAVRRGLAVAPAERHASMDALLAVLEPARRSATGTLAAVAAVAAAIAVVAVWSARGGASDGPAIDPCAGKDRALAGIWDRDVKQQLRRSFFATGRTHAEITAARVEGILDGYAAAWTAMATENCRATRVDRRQTEPIFTQREACLQVRLDGLAELTRSFTNRADGAAVDDAVHRAFDLEPIESCGLAGPAPPPDAGIEAPTTTCGLSAAGSFNAIELGRTWVYDVIDPATLLPRNQDPKVVTVEALERIGGCKGDAMAYRVRRAGGPGYAIRWMEVRPIAGAPGEAPGLVALRHRDQWFTDDGVLTKDEYFEPERVQLYETCERTLRRATFVEAYDEYAVVAGDTCAAPRDRETKTFDWRVVATELPLELRMDFSHPACCPRAGDCRPPPDTDGHRCRPTPGGRATDWTCTFSTLQVVRNEVRGGKRATYWFAPGVGKVKEDSRGDELESLVCWRAP